MVEDKMATVRRRSVYAVLFRESEWKIILVTPKSRWWDDITVVFWETGWEDGH